MAGLGAWTAPAGLIGYDHQIHRALAGAGQLGHALTMAHVGPQGPQPVAGLAHGSAGLAVGGTQALAAVLSSIGLADPSRATGGSGLGALARRRSAAGAPSPTGTASPPLGSPATAGSSATAGNHTTTGSPATAGNPPLGSTPLGNAALGGPPFSSPPLGNPLAPPFRTNTGHVPDLSTFLRADGTSGPGADQAQAEIHRRTENGAGSAPAAVRPPGLGASMPATPASFPISGAPMDTSPSPVGSSSAPVSEETLQWIIERIEQRIIDELERRGIRYNPGVF
ncbi:MAG TPA: hypothetical protein VKV06_16810 [Acidimicrobiales bacterium]|nr:hypothetical protein [Acidimicrobiales bacterium]